MSDQRKTGRRLLSPLIVTSVVFLLNVLIFAENAPRRAVTYEEGSGDAVVYYLGMLAAVVAWCGGLLSLLRRPLAGAATLLGSAGLFLLPLIWSHWGGDLFLIWWFIFSAVCGGLAWFSWMASRPSPEFAPGNAADAGAVVESWRRTMRLIGTLSWVMVIGIVALNMTLLVMWGFAIAMVWTVGGLVAVALVLRGIRAARMWRLGLSAEAVL